MARAAASGSLVPGAGSDPSVLESLRSWVRSHFGLSFSGDQGELFVSRIESFCSERALRPQDLLLQLTAGQRALTGALADALSTNHTFFFREKEIFDLLDTSILPSLAGGAVRVWSAASSSGDEAYSIAIAARERLGDAAAAGLVKILATDLSDRQLRLAEQGLFPAERVALVNAERRARWFTRAGLGQWQIDPELRKMCTFRRLNLTTHPWPFEQRFHLIFLRNVLYYFEPSTRRAIVEACFDTAEPGAWLVTSLTDPMLDMVTRWTPIRPAIFRKGPL